MYYRSNDYHDIDLSLVKKTENSKNMTSALNSNFIKSVRFLYVL